MVINELFSKVQSENSHIRDSEADYDEILLIPRQPRNFKWYLLAKGVSMIIKCDQLAIRLAAVDVAHVICSYIAI